MPDRKVILGLIGSLLVGVLLGRYSLPERKVTQEVSQTDTKTDKTDHSTTIVTETKKPDGTVTIRKETKNDISTQTKAEAKTDTKTEIDYDARKTFISAVLAFKPLSPSAPVYGINVQRRLLGPFIGGIQGMTDGSVGISLGITF